MNTLNSTLPANEARSNFYRMLEEIWQLERAFTITHRGKPQAVLMNADEYESWRETLEIMSDKKLMTELSRSRKSKKTFTLEETKKILKIA